MGTRKRSCAGQKGGGMKIISVVNQKGGCGKTITAVNLAAALGQGGKRVLLIDLDPQSHATFSVLRETPRVTITDLLEAASTNRSFPEGNLTVELAPNFHLLPASLGLASLEHTLTSRDDKLKIVEKFLLSAGLDFDYLLIDCPPNLGLLTLNALVASEYALIPLMTCDFSLQGTQILKNILLMIKEFKGSAPAPFYLLNQVDQRSRYVKQFLQKTRQQMGNLLLSSRIRTNVHLKEASANGCDVFRFKPDSRGAEDFRSLAKEMQRITGEVSWTPLFLKKQNLEEVYVVGDFNDWQKEDSYKLKKIGPDLWSINLSLEKGTYRYKFLAENKWIPDPHNALSENDSFGGRNSLLQIH
ncbi:MAG: AAA family ATPase [Candidatus Omnitrophica bacterium]|nr:AAA family ATPase [Candidatus Omnitrophota bacterium]